MSCFIQPALLHNPSGSSIVLAWHGTPIQHVEKLCRDGPRSLRTTDSGFFGTGSYFAVKEAFCMRQDTALIRYCRDKSEEMALVLFAISVTQVKPITVEKDYRDVQDPTKPDCHRFSNYCSGNAGHSNALARLCDAHFIPVKNYGKVVDR
ncbi:Hypothetical protein, putative [Bodo saltans]|uniref:Poly [ADP-ribose] polymerase n=1 Tax=Bodo saltans TaxID=75058 RepID=A0A0S4JAV3_BODSA|nr:Hypothetical protein, putative [Bodo saltans]|eukprot:CUG87283.1 Hypothetical protein, putative [Bodo saltans]